MNYDDITILRQEFGRFDNRFKFGPAKWPHHDLLWINEGAVKLWFGSEQEEVIVKAPAGLIIFPDTDFFGTANASINHFKLSGAIEGLGYL